MHGGDNKCVQDFSQRTWREETILETLRTDGRILLKSILKRKRMWTRYIWLGIWSSGGLLWRQYWTTGSIRDREFIDQLNDLDKDSKQNEFQWIIFHKHIIIILILNCFRWFFRLLRVAQSWEWIFIVLKAFFICMKPLNDVMTEQ